MKNDFSFPLTIAGGRHDFKAGVNYVHEPELGGSFSSGLTGRFTFNGSTLDSPISRIEFNAGASRFFTPMEQYSAYLQDDWQVTDRLQFNIGLRYDFFEGFDLDQSSSSLWQTLTRRLSTTSTTSRRFAAAKAWRMTPTTGDRGSGSPTTSPAAGSS